MIFIQAIFWLCLFLIIYSYLFYPLLLLIIHNFKRIRIETYSAGEELPGVSILISARNEGKIIEEKIRSIIESDYPHEKIEVIIGSDASDDNTDSIINKYSSQYPFISLHRFDTRSGKPFIINNLVQKAKNEIIILTDANVILDKDCIKYLVGSFKDKKCGLAGGNIISRSEIKVGIAQQEKFYTQFENNIKFMEGDCFGSMIGPFGGCYALRKKLYSPVPTGFAVDDFYIGMKVLEQNYYSILIKKAACFEDIPGEINIEFKRKRRIANGNFQNLAALKSFLLKPFSSTGFCFISHKVIRWFTPIIWLIMLACNLSLITNQLYFYLLIMQLIVPAIALLDALLMLMSISVKPLRYIAYFCRMNVALFFGLIDYLKGGNANVWEPTKRN